MIKSGKISKEKVENIFHKKNRLYLKLRMQLWKVNNNLILWNKKFQINIDKIKIKNWKLIKNIFKI
jgi:hypothetical protein